MLKNPEHYLLRAKIALLVMRVLHAIEDDGLAVHGLRCRRLYRRDPRKRMAIFRSVEDYPRSRRSPVRRLGR